MTYPGAMFIEMAVDTLMTRSRADLDHQLREFHCANGIAGVTLEGLTDAQKGYLVGLETARALLSTMPGAVRAEVSI